MKRIWAVITIAFSLVLSMLFTGGDLGRMKTSEPKPYSAEPILYSVVSAAEAAQTPYPYVWINEDGTGRELHHAEREVLEQTFDVRDSGRPYVKTSFRSRDGWGSIEGFCRRDKVPRSVQIGPAPKDNPNPPMTPEQFAEWFKSKQQAMEARKSLSRRWWEFWK